MRRWRPRSRPSARPGDDVARVLADEARRRAQDADMVEVVLVGPGEAALGDADAGARGTRRDDGPGTGHDEVPHRAARGRTRRSVPSVAVGVLAALLVGAAVRAALPAPAAPALPVDAPTASLAEPLATGWDVAAPSGATRAGDLVLVLPAPGTDDDLVALDSRTGRTRWTLPVEGRRGVAWCDGEAGPAGAAVVVCWRLPDRRDGGTDARVVLVDAADGTHVADRPAGPPSGGYGTVDGDLVLTERSGRDVVVRRVEPRTWAQRWSTVVRDVGRPVGGLHTAWVEVTHGWVVLHGATSAVLDAVDGRVIGTWRTRDVPAEELLERARAADVMTAPHGFGVWPDVVRGARMPLGTWYGPDGRARGPLDGFLVEPEVSDGSEPDVVLTRAGDGVRATDVTTGDEAWRRPGTPVARAGGLVVLSSAAGLVAADLRTGDVAWSAALPGVHPEAGVVSDGRSLVVAAHEQDRWLLVAVDLRAGTVRWTAAAPAAVGAPSAEAAVATSRWLHVVGDQVVVGVPGRLVGLRPEGSDVGVRR